MKLNDKNYRYFFFFIIHFFFVIVIIFFFYTYSKQAKTIRLKTNYDCQILLSKRYAWFLFYFRRRIEYDSCFNG